MSSTRTTDAGRSGSGENQDHIELVFRWLWCGDWANEWMWYNSTTYENGIFAPHGDDRRQSRNFTAALLYTERDGQQPTFRDTFSEVPGFIAGGWRFDWSSEIPARFKH